MTLASQLTARLSTALDQVLPDRPPEAVAAVVPAADIRFGDYQTNAAMVLAKSLRMNPRQLALDLVAAFHSGGLCDPPDVAGPGFINFRLTPAAIAAHVRAMLADPRLGAPRIASRRIVIDFSSPNVAKPMHVGHIRSTVLGDALARIGRFLGYSVITDNHIGDWGTQFGMLIVGWRTALDPAALAADPLAEMERIYKYVNGRCAEDPEVREAAKRELVRLQNGDPENLVLWRRMQELSQTQFDAVYGRLGVRFDNTLGESFYNPWLASVVDDLVASGLARESDGAICVFSDHAVPAREDPLLVHRDGDWQDNPALIRKADGGFNYTTTDLATLDYRISEWSPDQIVYVTDGRQQLHFRQLFAIFRRWKPEARVQTDHVWFGSILGDDGRPFRTRSGDTVRLAELLDEAEERAHALVREKNPALPDDEARQIARVVGIGAVKYADLLPNRQSDYIFSWDKMLSLQGNTAPYLQNAYVRTRSIFRKLGADPDAVVTLDALVVTAEAERPLALALARFGEVLPSVFDDFRPNILANYLYDLATRFHSFYEACPVLRAEEPARSTRLALCSLTGRMLRTGLDLLGIGVTEKM